MLRMHVPVSELEQKVWDVADAGSGVDAGAEGMGYCGFSFRCDLTKGMGCCIVADEGAGVGGLVAKG
jgi:hypothetical protein